MSDNTMVELSRVNAAPANYINFGFHVSGNAGEPYFVLNTRDLPINLTAWQLAQILNMTMRMPESVVRRDFAAVAHMFKPVEGE